MSFSKYKNRKKRNRTAVKINNKTYKVFFYLATIVINLIEGIRVKADVFTGTQNKREYLERYKILIMTRFMTEIFQ